MTGARVEAIHAKVNSLLSMCDLDTPLNGLLLHADTLCVLSYDGLEDLRGSAAQDGQEDKEHEVEEEGLPWQTGLGPASDRPRQGLPMARGNRPRTGLSPASARPAYGQR